MMNIETFKIPMDVAWPVLKWIFIIIGSYAVINIAVMWMGFKSMTVKGTIMLFKILISAGLFGLTLTFQYNPDGQEIYFKWPEEITLIQMFLLPILFIDMCTSIIDLLDPDSYK